MAVDFKDYYAVLGLKRDASEDDIKKAFRRLARLYHPDVAKDKKGAEAKFKEINEAHEVLSDPAKRRRYDELGANWDQAGAGRPPTGGRPPGWSGGAGDGDEEFHFGGTGFSDFFERFFGRGGQGGPDMGPGFGRGRRGRRAPEGFEEVERGSDIEGDLLVTLHEAMHGSLRSLSLRHTDPQTGQVETESFKVRIPPGAQEGRRIRVPGKGSPGAGGGPAGDLYLRVRLAAHPDFEVKGVDLYHELALAPWEAVLGARVAVPTLAGTIKVSIPAGTNSGRQLRVRGQGLPKGADGERGDLYVVASIQVPETVTAEERAAWEKLARESRFDPRSGVDRSAE
jgi:curved DNA-binding protein